MVKRIPREQLEHLIWTPDKELPERKPVEEIRSSYNQILTIDEAAAESGATKTQDKWIDYWNAVDDGRWFPSAPELYQVFRQIADEPEEHSTLLASIRKDFTERWLLSSTRIQYNGNDTMARIIHNYNSERQQEPIDIDIPVYRGDKGDTLIKVLGQDVGLEYFNALLGSDDSPEEIKRIFEAISGKDSDNTKVWTPLLDGGWSRAKRPERAVSFGYIDGDFLINCYDLLYYYGRSRGVRATEGSASGLGGVKGGGGA